MSLRSHGTGTQDAERNNHPMLTLQLLSGIASIFDISTIAVGSLSESQSVSYTGRTFM